MAGSGSAGTFPARHRDDGWVGGSITPKEGRYLWSQIGLQGKKKITKTPNQIRGSGGGNKFTASAPGEMAASPRDRVGIHVYVGRMVTWWCRGGQLLTWPPVSSPLGRSVVEAAGGRVGGHPGVVLLACLPAPLCERVVRTDPSSQSSSACWLYSALS